MNLKLLGISSYEEKAYISLTELGPSTAGDISKHSGVPYGKIYPTLESLESKGLISVIPDKTKKFQAKDPKNLIDLINNKKKEMDSLEKELVNLKQIYENNPKEAVILAKGKKNFYKLEREIPQPKKFEYDIKYHSEVKGEWINEAKALSNKGVTLKILTRYDNETKSNVDHWLKYVKNMKSIPNKGVAMSIVDDAVLLSMINNNTTLLIKDKATVELFKELFESYYNSKENLQLA
jgi:sugar-specific transcriptional regulator TrmB